MVEPLVVVLDEHAHLLDIMVLESAESLLECSDLGGTVLIHIVSPEFFNDILSLCWSTILDEVDDSAVLTKPLEELFTLILLQGELSVDLGVELGEVHVHGDGLGDVGEDEGGGEDSECAHLKGAFKVVFI